jgi:hypothetical protein
MADATWVLLQPFAQLGWQQADQLEDFLPFLAAGFCGGGGGPLARCPAAAGTSLSPR